MVAAPVLLRGCYCCYVSDYLQLQSIGFNETLPYVFFRSEESLIENVSLICTIVTVVLLELSRTYLPQRNGTIITLSRHNHL